MVLVTTTKRRRIRQRNLVVQVAISVAACTCCLQKGQAFVGVSTSSANTINIMRPCLSMMTSLGAKSAAAGTDVKSSIATTSSSLLQHQYPFSTPSYLSTTAAATARGGGRRSSPSTVQMSATSTTTASSTSNPFTTAANGLDTSSHEQQQHSKDRAPLDKDPLPALSQGEVRRYSRHLILEDVGVLGQRKLKQASVLVIGAGGLGSPSLLYLAAAGIGRLGIVDDDVVDESNLQRQVIHGTATLDKPKVQSAKDRIIDINPNCIVETVQEKLTSANALDLLANYDIILDGSDNFPTKYLVNDACVILGKPNVFGAILAFEGQVSVFGYKGGPNYRDLMPIPPPPGQVPSCAEGGVLGILPGVIGCIQATEVIKIILGKGSVLSGRLIVYNALQMTFREKKLLKRPDAAPIDKLIDYQGFCGFSTPASSSTADEPPSPPPAEKFTRITVHEAVDRLAEGWAPYVLDVRLPTEAAVASLPFVDHLCPHREVGRLVEEGVIPEDTDILVHCKMGGRSVQACKILASLGIERLYNLEGGITSWATEIDPSIAVY